MIKIVSLRKYLELVKREGARAKFVELDFKRTQITALCIQPVEHVSPVYYIPIQSASLVVNRL